MYVLNEFRRLGLGHKLLDIAIDFAKVLVIQGWSWIVQRHYVQLEHYI